MYNTHYTCETVMASRWHEAQSCEGRWLDPADNRWPAWMIVPSSSVNTGQVNGSRKSEDLPKMCIKRVYSE